jgi:hypothetical protein
MGQVTFTEFVDFVLSRLHEVSKHSRSQQFENIEVLARELEEPVDPHWPAEVARVLVEDGLVVEDAALSPTPWVAITGRGHLHVEGQGRMSSREGSETIVLIGGERNQVVVGSKRVSQVMNSRESA